MPRVIAGTARGIPIHAPKGSNTRPTLDRVREAVFSMLQPRLEGCRFADLYAGSGANGIEALSRGASYSVFVDNDSKAIAEIGLNLRRAKLDGLARRMRLRLPEGLEALMQKEDAFDVVYADPPFRFALYAKLLEQIELLKVRAERGIVVVEHDLSACLPERVGELSRTRQSKYGRVGISIFS